MWGGILLIAGCCIGAGMLGLPVLTGVAGFQPSVLLFFVSWLFMAVTGLIVLEVNLRFPNGTNLLSMAEGSLGPIGKYLTWLLFTFLFYSLMVAYIIGTGQLISDFTNLHESVASFLMLLVFAIFLYLGTASVDHFNRFLMVGVFITYVLLVFFGVPYVHMDYLKQTDWTAAAFVVPAMVISFGYHNLIPTLRTYMEGNVKQLRTMILIGSGIPLLVYLVWEFVILGLIPLDGLRQAVDGGEMATRSLRHTIGSGWIVDIADLFAFFAIVTSLLSVALSFVDFLSDGLRIKKTPFGKIILIALCLLPPFLFGLVYPKVFLVALSCAGAYGAVILFGILPALMAWKGPVRFVPGGKWTLSLVILFAISVIILEIIKES